jgi:hypothetical protein
LKFQESCCFKLLEKFDIFNENQNNNNILLDIMSHTCLIHIHIKKNTLSNQSNILFSTVMKKCPLYLRIKAKVNITLAKSFLLFGLHF